MKLWLLRPVADLPEDEESNPWEPWYDKAFGLVVRAEDEATARALADNESGDEKREFSKKPVRPWLDPHYSTCAELLPAGPAGVVLRDFHAA